MVAFEECAGWGGPTPEEPQDDSGSEETITLTFEEVVEALETTALDLIDNSPYSVRVELQKPEKPGDPTNENFRLRYVPIVPEEGGRVSVQMSRYGYTPDEPEKLAYIDEEGTHWLLNHRKEMGKASLWNIPEEAHARDILRFLETVG